MICVILALLPTILLGKFIYNKDKVEKESGQLLTKLFMGGILSTFLTLILTFVIRKFLPFLIVNPSELTIIECFVSVFIGIALIEEFAKWIFVKAIAWNNREFDHVYDAIVYSTFVALGFASLENILYVFLSDAPVQTAILRAITAVPGHAFDGILMGYYIGIAKLCFINKDAKRYQKNMFLSILVPVIVHTLYDFILMVNISVDPSVIMLCFYGYVMLVFLFAYSKIKKLSKVSVMMIGDNKSITPVYGVFGKKVDIEKEKAVIEDYTKNIKIKYCGNCGASCTERICSNCGYRNY